MSSVVVSTSAALGRPFLFDADTEPEVGSDSEAIQSGWALFDQTVEDGCSHKVFQPTVKNQKSQILASSIAPASRLAVRPGPEMAPSGIADIDSLTGGLPRGCLTEICGPASSGRTTVLLAALAAASRRGEYCAVIDASDALDPHSLDSAGVDLDHLLWVRCGDELPQKKNSPQRHRSTGKSFPDNSRMEPRIAKYQSEERLEQVLRATDLLLESGGFGLIILDLADVPPLSARRIPLTTWFRFRRAVEHKPTILLAIEQQPIAGSCSSLLLQLGVSTQYSVLSSNRNFVGAERDDQDVQSAHTELFTGLEINAELIRSRLDRKPSRSVTFETKTAWAG